MADATPCTPENCGDAFSRCGKYTTYSNWRCRCVACSDAWREKCRAHRVKNLDQIKEQKRKYYYANHAERRAAGKRWYEENKESALEASRRWHAANPDKVREAHRKYHAENPHRRGEFRRNWRSANKLKDRAATERRRALKMNAPTVTFTAEQWAQRVAYWGGRCYLGIPDLCTGDAEVMDHVKPLSKGGSHMLANLRPACQACNSSKNNRWPYAVAGGPTIRR